MLEKHTLTPRSQEGVIALVAARGMQMRARTLLEATIVQAPRLDQVPYRCVIARGASIEKWQPVLLQHDGTHRRGLPLRLVRVVMGTAGDTGDVTQVGPSLTGEQATVHPDAAYN